MMGVMVMVAGRGFGRLLVRVVRVWGEAWRCLWLEARVVSAMIFNMWQFIQDKRA